MRRSWMSGIVCLAIALFQGGWPIVVFATTMASPSYQIPWDAVGSGGNEQGGSASYFIDDTLGGAVAGAGSSASYSTKAGYRFGDEQALSFGVRMAPIGGVSAPYVSINTATNLITLDPSVTNPFHVGDFIAAIDGPGLGQKTVIGKVITIAGLSVVVDRFDGQPFAMNAVPVSGVVRLLSGGDLAFSAPSVSTGAVASGMLSVTAPTPSGYTLYGQATGPLASSGHTMTAVADGVVTAGTEEYGIITLGLQAALVSETALSATPVSVQHSTISTGPQGDRTAFLYKFAISAGTPAGSYGQSLYFTLTPNY